MYAKHVTIAIISTWNIKNYRYVMTHKYRGSIVVLSISKSVEPNEELKVGYVFSQVLSTIDTTLRTLDVYSF